MATYEEIKKANESLKTTPISGKNYVEVNERIKAFRMIYPEGFIISEMTSEFGGVCVVRSEVGFYSETGEKIVLGVGHAYEKEGSNFINKTSYVENCETSAVGRALGIAGFGIDTSVASAEEVANAIANQNSESPADERKATPKQIEFLAGKYTGENLEKLLKSLNIQKLEDITLTKASELISKIKSKKEDK